MRLPRATAIAVLRVTRGISPRYVSTAACIPLRRYLRLELGARPRPGEVEAIFGVLGPSCASLMSTIEMFIDVLHFARNLDNERIEGATQVVIEHEHTLPPGVLPFRRGDS